MKSVLRFFAELIVMIAGIICFGCVVCVMNGNNKAIPLGLICLAVMVIAVVIDERRKK